MTIVPPIDPTKPPMSFAFFGETPDEELLSDSDDAAVGTVTKVVIVVSGRTLMVDT